jgi:hypothetical protein
LAATAVVLGLRQRVLRARPVRWVLATSLGMLSGGLIWAGLGDVTRIFFDTFLGPCVGASVGALAGLGAASSWAILHVELAWPDGVARAWAEADAHLTGDEREPALRALHAYARIKEGLGSSRTPDRARLRGVVEVVTRQILALALRCRTQAEALAAVDVSAARLKAAGLSAAALKSSDEAARADLVRAARAIVTRDLRLRDLAALNERVRARLELHVASLEGTALSVTLQQASAAVDEAAAFEPLVGRLREAGDDLHAQAQALNELHLTETTGARVSTGS